MNRSYLLYFPLFLITFMACTGAKQLVDSTANAPVVKEEKVIITAVFADCGDQLKLYQFDGIDFKFIQSAAAIGGDTFQLSLPKGDIDMYYLGTDRTQKRPLVIGPDNAIHVNGHCKNPRLATITQSAYNQKYDEVIKTIRQNKQQSKTLRRQLKSAFRNPEKLRQLEGNFTELDQKRLAYAESLQADYPFLAKVAQLDTYQSFAGNKKDYNNEVDHYSYEFFANVNLADPIYNNITYLFEVCRDYTNMMSAIGFSKNELVARIDSQLKKIPADSRAYKYALGGITLALQSKNNPAFVDFGKRYAEKYTADGGAVARLEQQLTAAESLVEGGSAPDFSMNTPEGTPLQLSSLRGNVILLDFWASWCGPCRKENPHVVKLYHKYKEKGFDILGVSLDNKKDRWLGAIEKDGLEWNHVSDLKGWQNEAAATYSVRSIPHTYLLDREGKIIAQNLRGAALDNKLKEIFGF